MSPHSLGWGILCTYISFFLCHPYKHGTNARKKEHVRTCFYFELCKGIGCGFKDIILYRFLINKVLT